TVLAVRVQTVDCRTLGSAASRSDQRQQVIGSAGKRRQPAKPGENQECDWTSAKQVECFHHESENEDHSGDLKFSLEGIGAQHQLLPFQNFASFKLRTSCAASRQLLEMQEVFFIRSAGRRSGSGVWTPPSSK